MIDVLINGQSGLVRDIEQIGFKSVFAKEFNELELTTDMITLVNESKSLIMQHIAIYGGEVGMPVTITDETNSYEYLIDFTERPIFSERGIDVKIRKRKGKGVFMENALGTTFESLRAQGVNFPIFSTPYVIIHDNQVGEGLTISLALFSMTQAFLEALKSTEELATQFASAVAGLSVALTLDATAKLVIQLAYNLALLKAILEMVKRLRELIFPKLRYFNACNIKNLLAVSCQQMGYTFKSTLLDSLPGLTILPVPLQKNNKSIFNFIQDDLVTSFNKGYPTSSDTTPTVGLLIQAIELTFNAKCRLVDGQVQIERRDYWSNISSISLTPALNDQDKRQDIYTLNTQDAWCRYFIQYQSDFTDLHTLNDFNEKFREIGAKNTNQLDADLNLLKGLRQIDVPFSLGSRKNELNFIENLALDLFSIIEKITGLQLTSLIENRLGALQLSQQFFEITKLLYCENNKQPSNYFSKIGATALYSVYHFIEEMNNNSFREYENAPIILNFAQYNQILQNNYITINGVSCEVLSIEYIPYKNMATINYREPDTWSLNKISTFVVN